jgi:hypothetical protein
MCKLSVQSNFPAEFEVIDVIDPEMYFCERRYQTLRSKWPNIGDSAIAREWMNASWQPSQILGHSQRFKHKPKIAPLAKTHFLHKQ